ncbi:MAG: response regulator [Lachnospiraceae bacterium]|nr:response regulator [Lachnospiraceae bacterium]
MSEKITILVGDDSILARKQLKDILIGIQDNLTFVEASNGQEAVDKFKEVHPDIVFLDIVMPVKDGIGATTDIIAADSSAKIIIVSSVGTQSQLKSAIEAGAKDFIQKPIRAEQVTAIFNTYIGG